MQKVVSKYFLAAHLALTAVAPQFFPLGAVLCLAAITFCWLLFEPSRIGEESLHAARRRVASAIARDPVFWLSIAILIYSAVRMFNTGVALTYDVESDAWSLSEGVFPSLPASSPGRGGAELAASASMVVVLQGCRNALGRMARGAFMLLFAAFSGVGGIVCCIMSSFGDRTFLSLASCGLSTSACMGVYYALALVMAISSYSVALHYRWYRAILLLMVAVAGNAAAFFVFSPPAVTLLFSLAAVLLFLYGVFWHYVVDNPAQGLVFVSGIVFFLMGAVVLSMIAIPSGLMEDKLSAFLGETTFLPADFKAVYSALSDASLSLWKTHPWLGSGLGSFADAVKTVAHEDFWSVVPSELTSSCSVHWMVLTERGSIGAFVILSLLCLLLFTYLKRWVLSFKSLPQPAALAGFILFIACALDSLFDVSLLSAGSSLSLLIMLAVSASTFAKVKNNV